MKEQLTVVTRKGQITVPVEIRRALGLKIGDRVALSMEDGETGSAQLRPIRSVVEMTFGAISPRRHEDTHDLRDVAMEEIAENAVREGVIEDVPEE